MSLAFRFKAGGSDSQAKMAQNPGMAHHHRSTTKSDHKPFKSRFASKGELKDRAKGKVESKREDKGKRKTPHQQVMSKLARRNQAKQLRMHHKDKQEQESNIFHGIDGAPKHVAVVPLSSKTDVQSTIQKLNESVDLDIESQPNGTTRARIDRFRRNLLYLPAKFELVNALDVCKLADWVIFVLDAEQEFDKEVDIFMRTIEGQGITSFVAVVQNLDSKIPASKRSRHLVDLKTAVGRYLPSLDKLSSLDSKSDCSNLVRSLCTASSKGIRWRDDRSWMLLDSVTWPDQVGGAEKSRAVLTGIIRGKGLNPDRLVHVPGWGDFQIGTVKQIVPQGQKRKAEEMTVDEISQEWGPTAEQEDLAELAPETADMTDVTSTVATNEHKGVLLDDHHYFSDDNSHIPSTPKKLPVGTSTYQSAWYLEDISDSDSDYMEEDHDGDVNMDPEKLGPEDGIVADTVDMETEAAPSEYPVSEMHVDANEEEEARQLQEYRTSRKNEAEEDLEFPDEIELTPETLARERLAKYRGLKSLRTSEWNHAEDTPYEPSEYKRLLQIADYKKSNNATMKEALAGGIPVGTKVEIELLDVPVGWKSQPAPSAMYSLLRHEHKHAVINLNFIVNTDYQGSIRAKDELIVQIGHRRLVINPIFSAQGQTPNDVHKYDRYLHAGWKAVASFIGPMTWGSVPVLVFKRQLSSATEDDNGVPNLVDSTMADPTTSSSTTTTKSTSSSSTLQFVGTATTIPPSNSRVIAKRVILTGHPFKIHKKLVTIRYMFFNREDVMWFAALPLWTKRGRQGFIKEPLGTHGYFKATFDGKINPLDAVGVSLYKRVWPRGSTSFDEE